MMETSKAQRRRCAEASEGKFDWDKIFKGDGADVGSGDDPLKAKNCIHIDLPDGAGDSLVDYFEKANSISNDCFRPTPSFDYVHGSNVLEHALDPVVMLRSWIDCLKPGGYIVATVPDYELYEHRKWPSQFNDGHRTAWTMNTFLDRIILKQNVRGGKAEDFLIKLPEWLNQFLNTDKPCEILLCRLVTTNYNFDAPDSIDQTLNESDAVECFIEFCLRKI